jgi:YidC/Oxa1 family membrane protein insertase
MFLRQKLNPPPRPVQARMFQFMPVIFVHAGAFPAGLVIYWSWNNLLSSASNG